MRKLNSINNLRIPQSSKDVWAVISDIKSYPKWWPSSLKIKVVKSNENLIGSHIEIRPYGGIPFYCEFTEKFQNTKLVMKYTGIYSGFGEWRLTEINNQTEVVYEINLEITNKFINALSKLLSLEKIHHNLMDKLLINLKQRVGEVLKANE